MRPAIRVGATAAVAVAVLAAAAVAGLGQAPTTASGTFSLSLAAPDQSWILRGVGASSATHLGRKAVRLIEAPTPAGNGETIAILPEPRFQDGTIEIDVAGRPRPGAFEGARGFVGVLFRSTPDGSSYECLYLRPTNGRAEDQLRRNHSTQYISYPEYDFARFRKEAPGVYESYVDLETGAWTHLRIQIAGTTARLYVHDAAQPVLIVNDLKHGVSSGRIGLWIGDGTEAFFSSLKVRFEK